MRSTPGLRRLAIVLAAVALLGACGDDDDPGADAVGDTSSDTGTETDPGTVDTDDSDGTGSTTPIAGSTDDTFLQDLAARIAAEGAGSATLTIADETWTFAPILCTPGDEVGIEGSVLAFIGLTDDGLQLSVDLNETGSTIGLEDVASFGDPSLSWEANQGVDGDIVDFTVDGDRVEVTTEHFRDGLTEGIETFPGTVSATCA